MYKVAVTDDRYGSYTEEINVLKEIGAELVILDPENKEEFDRGIADADALLVNLHPITEDLIKKLDKCKVMSRYGVGYDNVDVDAATKKGIWVARVPDYSIEDVSDQAIALLLGCVRKIAYKDRMIRNGKWNLHSDQPCHRIKDGVLGLIGYGAISRRLHEKTMGFGLSKVLVYDPYVDDKKIIEKGGVPSDLDSLLADSDYISVHVPLADNTRGMIGKKQLQFMKRGTILINTSRGAVLNEADVTEALETGRITGAGLDVFETEPLAKDSPLRELDNVILSDHTGWYSEESKEELKTKAALNIAAVLKGGKPVYAVNEI
ncbi:MAG: C-terminal binding protein [Spirochaetia bacterium]|jgi:D-3-phosphoglycerate dehydrogenase|nr:C-terminal binding protein [Spirochaetia bacterium]